MGTCVCSDLAPHPDLGDLFFFFDDPPPTELYTLSLHDALPISGPDQADQAAGEPARGAAVHPVPGRRSEEHTSELQSHSDLVCRLLLEQKKTTESYLAAVGHAGSTDPYPSPR